MIAISIYLGWLINILTFFWFVISPQINKKMKIELYPTENIKKVKGYYKVRNGFKTKYFHNGKQHHIGIFEDELSAAFAYNKALLKVGAIDRAIFTYGSKEMEEKHAVDGKNRAPPEVSSSKYHGVYKLKYGSGTVVYDVKFIVDGKFHYVGRYEDEITAAKAYDEAIAIKYNKALLDARLRKKANFNL
jgi:hypothetical protein